MPLKPPITGVDRARRGVDGVKGLGVDCINKKALKTVKAVTSQTRLER